MASQARKRLIRDFRKLQRDPPHGVSGAPLANDIMKWRAVIFGPEDTPWEGGTFQLEMLFSTEYPNRPPQVRFLSKLFHPNVYTDGSICLDILQAEWSPVLDISAILTSIQSLLSDPNPNSPANQEAARLFAENRGEYNRRVRECASESWKEVLAEEEAAAAEQQRSAENGGGGGLSPAAAETSGGERSSKDRLRRRSHSAAPEGEGEDQGEGAAVAPGGSGGSAVPCCDANSPRTLPVEEEESFFENAESAFSLSPALSAPQVSSQDDEFDGCG